MIKKRKAILQEALKCKDLKKLDKRDFLKVWRAVFFLHPYLHPDGYNSSDGGWTKRLKPLAAEAWRRFKNGQFSENNLYPVTEAMKGLEARKK